MNKLYAVTVLGRCANPANPLLLQRIVQMPNEDEADLWGREEFHREFGLNADRVIVTEVPELAMRCVLPQLPKVAEWIVAATVTPTVGAPALSGILNAMARANKPREIPLATLTPDGPMARIHAGIAIIERAWEDLPVHDPDDPYRHAPEDGH